MMVMVGGGLYDGGCGGGAGVCMVVGVWGCMMVVAVVGVGGCMMVVLVGGSVWW